MSRKPLLWLIAAAVIGLSGVVVYLFREDRSPRRHSQETDVLDLLAERTELRDDYRIVHLHTLSFAYVVGGVRYTRTLKEVAWYEENQRYKVCFNPREPKDAKLARVDRVCGQ